MKHLKKKLSHSDVSPTKQMRSLHKFESYECHSTPETPPCLSHVPTRSTSSLARLITWCTCFVIATCACYHKSMGLCNIVMEHGVGTPSFVPLECSAFDLSSCSLGCTAVPCLELGTQLMFLDWITDEMAPLSTEFSLTICPGSFQTCNVVKKEQSLSVSILPDNRQIPQGPIVSSTSVSTKQFWSNHQIHVKMQRWFLFVCKLLLIFFNKLQQTHSFDIVSFWSAAQTVFETNLSPQPTSCFMWKSLVVLTKLLCRDCSCCKSTLSWPTTIVKGADGSQQWPVAWAMCHTEVHVASTKSYIWQLKKLNHFLSS